MNAGRSFDYDIYIPSNLDKGIELFKESGSFITTFDITQINTIKSFYIMKMIKKNINNVMKDI